MANWLNYKFLLLISLLLCSFIPTKSYWGFYGHKTINQMAIFTLPPEMVGFYKKNMTFIKDHAVDPDKRRYTVKEEACRHYIDLDHYNTIELKASENLPKRWNDATAKFTEDTLKEYGIVPWHIQTMKFRLQKAFEEKNVDLILKYSAEIGHYIADANVPLHTTENYNGQLTNQHGIHALWETNIVELSTENYNFFQPKVIYISNLLDYTWEMIYNAHDKLDSVLSIEKNLSLEFSSDKKYSFVNKGKQVVKTYSEAFVLAYEKRLNGMVERQMKKAIHSIGSIWYTAWIDAGQPDLSTLSTSTISIKNKKEATIPENCIH